MNDLINRQEAIDILQLGAEILRRVLDDMDVVGIDREKYSYGLKLLESDIEDIKELPPAQLERKTGHWVKSDMQRWYDVWLCSECGEKTDSAVMSKPRYKYCPMCGAKMEGWKVVDENDNR